MYFWRARSVFPILQKFNYESSSRLSNYGFATLTETETRNMSDVHCASYKNDTGQYQIKL